MKKSLYITTLYGLIFGFGLLTACGNNNGGNTPAVNSTLPTCVSGNCFYNYGTPAQYGVNSTIGFRAESQSAYNMPYGGYQPYGGYNVYPQGYQQQAGSMQVQQGYINVLREAMGVCDRAAAVGGYSGGQAGCSSWMGGQHSISFGMNSTSSTGVQLTIKSNYQSSGMMNYFYSIPSLGNIALNILGFPAGQNNTGYYNPLILNGTISPVNNSQGFEIRAYGPTGSVGYNKLFQLQVPSGKVQDQSVQFVLIYNGSQAASGTMTNCGSSVCAMGY